METFTASAYRSKTSRRKTQRRVRKGDVNVHASSIAEMMDKVMQNTVGEYLKTLIEGEWKPIFEAYYAGQNGDQNGDDSDDDSNHSDDDSEKGATPEDKTAKHVIGGLKVWNEMTHQSRGLSFISYPFGYYSCASAVPVAEVGEESKVGEKKKNDNAYLRFCKVTRVQIKTENPSLKFGQITTETAQRWRNLSPEEKAAFAPPPLSEPEAPVAVINNETEAVSGEESGHQNDQVVEEEEETVPQEMATQVDKYPPTQGSECNGFDYSPKSVDEDPQEDQEDPQEEEEDEEDEALEGQKIQVTITRDFVDKKKRLELTGSQRNMLANLQKNSKSEILQMVKEANLDHSGMGPPSKIGKSELINLFMNFSFSS
jgi:hypothetical protein